MADIRRTSEYRKLLPFIARASGDVGSDTVGEDVSALLLALETHKTSGDHDGRYYTETEIANLFSTHSQSDDHDGRYYTETEIDLALALKADKTITLTAGDGLTGGGNLSENRTFNVVAGDGITVYADSVDVLPGLGIDFDSNGAVIVDLTENYAWTGNHSFTQTMYAGSIMPHNSDTYDLGSSASLWRKIWGSELSAVVFAQYEQTLLGGWFTVSKGEGVLPADILSTDTTIDLGAGTYEANDVLVFRGVIGSNPQVEYIRVVSLSSGTTYNVTRDLDGTGANDWQTGTVFANYGQTGDGRIELNAYDSPRISVFSHSDTIANFREQVRIGDLINGWGYSASTYGGAFGAYESGKANITIDPTSGIRIRNYDQTVIQLTGTEASFENVIKLGTNGRLQQGTGTWGTDFTGSAIWNDSGAMMMGGWNNNVKQWWGGSDGKFYAGDGNVLLDVNGVTLKADSFEATPIKFYTTGGLPTGSLSGYGSPYKQQVFLTGKEDLHVTGEKNLYLLGTNIEITSSRDSDWAGTETKLLLKHYNPNDAGDVKKLEFRTTGVELNANNTIIDLRASRVDISGDLVVDGTIKDYLGSDYVLRHTPRFTLGAGDFAYANGAAPGSFGGILVASFPNSSASIIDFAVVNNRPGEQLRIKILTASSNVGMLNYYCEAHRAVSGYGFPVQSIFGNLSISISAASVVHEQSTTLNTSAWNDGDLILIRIYRDANDTNGGTGYILGVIIDWV